MIPNPIIAGFHPDPSVCRVGDRYYLACSSFEYFPGVPLFTSDDLLHWRQLGNVLDRAGQLRLSTARPSGGVYAPTLRHHDGRFWLATTNVSDGGHLIVTATDPAGPWSDPVFVEGLTGIDPDLAWDGDGTCWFTYSSPADAPAIMQAPIDPLAGRVLAAPHRLWSGTGRAFPEAPHLYQVGGHWYLVIAEGGTGRGHAISVARGPGPTGPFQGAPRNPVLSHSGTDSPVQNTGHGDLVRAADGSWWMVLLGVRPRGGFPGYHVQGRETFLTRVRWVDGWPVPDPVALPDSPPAQPTQDRDDFDAEALGPQWISVRGRDPRACSLAQRPGWLTLHGPDPAGGHSGPAFVGRRQQHANCVVRARLSAVAGRGGLSVRLDDRHHYDIEATSQAVRCTAHVGPITQELADRRIGSEPVVLRIEVRADPTSMGAVGDPPDWIRLGLELDDLVVSLAELDGRYLSTEVAGGFTGRVIGMYAAAGTVAFDWYEYAA